MKYILILIIAICLYGCGDCGNSKYYQIRAKSPDGNSKSLCRYKVDGIGTCAAWQTSEEFYFTDSCSSFVLSQVVSRAMIDKYRKGI